MQTFSVNFRYDGISFARCTVSFVVKKMLMGTYGCVSYLAQMRQPSSIDSNIDIEQWRGTKSSYSSSIKMTASRQCSQVEPVLGGVHDCNGNIRQKDILTHHHAREVEISHTRCIAQHTWAQVNTATVVQSQGTAQTDHRGSCSQVRLNPQQKQLPLTNSLPLFHLSISQEEEEGRHQLQLKHPRPLTQRANIACILDLLWRQ